MALLFESVGAGSTFTCSHATTQHPISLFVIFFLFPWSVAQLPVEDVAAFLDSSEHRGDCYHGSDGDGGGAELWLHHHDVRECLASLIGESSPVSRDVDE